MPWRRRLPYNCPAFCLSHPIHQDKVGRPNREERAGQRVRTDVQRCRRLPGSRRYASVSARSHEPAAGTLGIVVTEPGSAGLGAVATGLDIQSPAPEDREALRRAFRASPMLCIRGCKATPESFLRLARIFGALQRELMGVLRDTAYPEISVIERRQGISTATGKTATFGGHWHTDDSYMAVPCAATLLYGELVPPRGGDTHFTNMHAAYDALPAETKARISGLRAVHTYQSRRNRSPVPERTEAEKARTPPVTHPLARTHPETGRKALYLNPNRIDRVCGMPLADGDVLLDKLIAHAAQPAFVHVHAWQPDDVVIWDNRCTMHKASPHEGDHPRRLLRILIKGTVPA